MNTDDPLGDLPARTTDKRKGLQDLNGLRSMNLYAEKNMRSEFRL